MARDVDVRIDGVKKEVHSVLWAVKVIWKNDVAGIMLCVNFA